MSYQKLYNNDVYYSSEYTSSDNNETDDESTSNNHIDKFTNNRKYEDKNIFLIINTEDRDWTDTYKDTFSFQVRLNASQTSNEIRDNYDDIKKFNRTLTVEKFNGSTSMSIPLEIKNINSISINRILVPTRDIYLGNGNFKNLLNLKNLNVVIEEFSKVNYGTNNISNSIFSSLIIFTPIYPETVTTKIPNYVEFKNIRVIDKEFKPAPLNAINSLTFSFYDNLGNKLNYLDNILDLKAINSENGDKHVKITTTNYFNTKNYRTGDIIIIKNVKNISDNKLKLFLERKEGHKIYFESSLNLDLFHKHDTVNDLANIFYIRKEGEYDLEGIYQTFTSEQINKTNLEGKILNRNLEMTIYMTINNRNKSFDIFDTEII